MTTVQCGPSAYLFEPAFVETLEPSLPDFGADRVEPATVLSKGVGAAGHMCFCLAVQFNPCMSEE